jgi:hypothetical protein
MTEPTANKLPKGFAAMGWTEVFTPNSIPLKERVRRTLLAFVLILYGAIGVWIDDLYIPGKRSKGAHLHGPAAWIAYLAMLCGAAVLLSVVLDHYDRRDNEHKYETFRKHTKILAWTFLGLAVVSQLVQIFMHKH